MDSKDMLREINGERIYNTGGLASAEELTQAGFFGEEGPIIGLYESDGVTRILRLPFKSHVLVTGLSQIAGKTTGYALTNALSYKGSMVFFDPKRDIVNRSAAYRRSLGQDVYIWDPNLPWTLRFNPLLHVTTKKTAEEQSEEAKFIAEQICPAEEDTTRGGDFFINQRRLLLPIFLLYVGAIAPLGTDRPWQVRERTFAEIYRLLTLKATEVREVFTAMSKYDGKLIAIGGAGASLLEMAPAQLCGVMDTLRHPFGIFADPLLAEATSASDFQFHELCTGATTIFINVNQESLESYRPLVRLMLAYAMREVVRETRDKFQSDVDGWAKHRLPVRIVIDEMPQLGAFPLLRKYLGFAAAYGMRLDLMCQSQQQLTALFPTAMQEISENCACKLHFAPLSHELAEYLSAILGTHTVSFTKTSESRSTNTPLRWHPSLATTDEEGKLSISNSEFLSNFTHASETVNVTSSQEIIERPRRSAADLRAGGMANVYIEVSGMKLIEAQKAFYWRHNTLLERSKLHDEWNSRAKSEKGST